MGPRYQGGSMGVWATLRRHCRQAATPTSHPARRTFLAGCLASLAAGALPAAKASAAEPVADTSLKARTEAARLLPLSELTAETRRKLLGVVERPTIFRRMPSKSFDCDPELYLFLI